MILPSVSPLLPLLSPFFSSHEGQVRHYHIKNDEEKQFYISEKHRFPTIKGLIEYHKLNGGGNTSYHGNICVHVL